MKVFFKGSFYFSDNEFCLIKALQDKNIDVKYYIPIEYGRLKGALLDIKTQYPKTGIFPASIYKEIDAYKDYFDISKVFVINSIHKSNYHPANLLLKLKLILEYVRFNPDIFHFSAPLTRPWMFLYWLYGKKVLTLHDPFPHSGQYNDKMERSRIIAFKHSDNIIMLDKENVDKFSDYYNYPKENIYVSKLGYFDYLKNFPYEDPIIEGKYILFFGQIFQYKGIEYLLEAMIKVHKVHPDIKLVVAGGGKYYFDIEPYIKLDYIIIKNEYIKMKRLVGLLRNCMFSVAPYTDATQSGLLLNSFSLSIPMVASSVGHFPKMIKEGEFGLLVKPRNVDDLANAIIKLIESPILLEKMRDNISNEWIPSMQWASIADDFIKCYNS